MYAVCTMQATTVTDWLKSTWSALGVVLGIVYFVLNRRNGRKALTYSYTHGDVAVVSGAFKSDVEILYKGNKIENASVVTITIKSSGGSSIGKSDFDGGLRLTMPGTSSILLVRVSSDPPELTKAFQFSAESEPEPNARVIEPMLLNSGDTLSIFVLVSGFGNKVHLTGRIAGVRKIEARTDGYVIELSWPLGLVTTLAGIALGRIGMVTAKGSIDWGHLASRQLIELGIGVVILVVAGSLWQTSLSRRKA